MRAREFLILESSGLFNRKQGDEFVNSATGGSLKFVSITAYPSNGKFASIEEREAVRREVSQGKPVEWVNPAQEKAAGYLAFAIAELTDSDGRSHYWGRYFREIVGSMMKTWPNNEVPAGWKLNTKAAAKINLGFDPQRLIGSEQVFGSAEAAVQHVVARLGADHQLSRGLEDLLQGRLPKFVGMAEQMPAIRDYFGEIMAPLALARDLVGGSAAQAQQDLLVDAQGGTYSWDQCQVKWPMSVSHNLVDSYMIAPSGVEVGISSKGGVGARASVKNIYDIYLRIKDTNPQLVQDYAAEIAYLEIIFRNSQFYGPLELAGELGIIDPRYDQAIADEILALTKNPSGPVSNLLRPFMDNRPAKTAASNYNPGYHALAGIAEQVADKLNTETRMIELLKLLLNNSSIIQIYTNMAVKGSDAVVTGFNAIFPAKFQGTISISANKGYSATGIKQKFVFGFD